MAWHIDAVCIILVLMTDFYVFRTSKNRIIEMCLYICLSMTFYFFIFLQCHVKTLEFGLNIFYLLNNIQMLRFQKYIPSFYSETNVFNLQLKLFSLVKFQFATPLFFSLFFFVH